MAYTVVETERLSISATLRALSGDDDRRSRQLMLDMRVGDYALDNPHQIRGGGFDFGFGSMGYSAVALPIDDDPIAVKQAIWLQTDRRFRDAADRFARVKTNVEVKVEEEDRFDDFTRAQPNVSINIANPAASLRRLRQIMRGGRFGGFGGSPGEVVRVYPDGREQRVRGLQFGNTAPKSPKRIEAAGSTPVVYDHFKMGLGGGAPAATIVAPSVLL